MTDAPNIAQHMNRVARELLGTPNKRLSKQTDKELRYGTNGSLAIDLAKGTFFDFETNKGGGVLDLIAREKNLTGKAAFEFLQQIGCDVPETAKTNGRSRQEPAKPTRKLIATFDYQTAEGALAFQVLRYAPKQFVQRRPDGNGGWDYHGGPPLPYRLPELLEATAHGRTVFVVEGEAKVDALAKWNVPATCNAGGSKKWKPEHSAHLRGAEVVIVPDNDEAGREHANTVVAALQGIAASVRVLELPGLKPKGDIVNWIEGGGTVDQLWRLVETKARPLKDDTNVPLVFINISAWHAQPVPEREWTVKDRVPAKNVTLLSGEGSIGKSILSLQLAVATVLGRDWLGTLPEPGAVLVVGCEDDEDEQHRRLDRIAQHYSASFTEFRDMHLMALAGEETLMAVPDRAGLIQPTRLFVRIREAAFDIRPKLIVLDNAADIYGGNENDRAQVRQFIGLLRGMAITSGAGVVLTSHPSLTGVSSGTGLSGSTAWNASVRSRLYFKRAVTDKDEEPDPDLRVLEVMKNNYGPAGETITLRWKDGLFLPVVGVSSLDRLAAAQRAEHLFLSLLNRFADQGRNLSDKATSNNYAPTVLAKEKEARENGLRKRDLEAAMRALFAADKIVVQTYGSPSKGWARLVVK